MRTIGRTTLVAKAKFVLHSADPTLQPKEVPLEFFFPKSSACANHCAFWSQNSIGPPKLNGFGRVEMQHTISRSYEVSYHMQSVVPKQKRQFSHIEGRMNGSPIEFDSSPGRLQLVAATKTPRSPWIIALAKHAPGQLAAGKRNREGV